MILMRGPKLFNLRYNNLFQSKNRKKNASIYTATEVNSTTSSTSHIKYVCQNQRSNCLCQTDKQCF